MSGYTYSVSPSFATNDNVQALETDIVSAVQTNFIQTVIIGDSIHLQFSGPLSLNEISILNGLVMSHDNIQPEGKKQLVYSIENDDVVTTIYIKLLTFIFPGTDSVSGITHIKISGYTDDEEVPYAVRLYDILNNNIVAEGTFNNTEHAIQNLDIVGQMPSSTSVFELQAKITGSSMARVRSFIIYYG